MEKETQYTADHMDTVRQLVADVGAIIDKVPALREMNFGLFYQHGRLGFMDLDAFAESTKVRLNPEDEEQTLTEMKNSIDKEEN